jgi:hypothetical protein
MQIDRDSQQARPFQQRYDDDQIDRARERRGKRQRQERHAKPREYNGARSERRRTR